MKKSTIAGAFIGLVVLILVVWSTGRRDRGPDVDPPVAIVPAIPPSTGAASAADRGFLYGRIVTNDGATYEGRLRWGGDEEAFWGDYFNGLKDENPWAAHVPPEQLRERSPIEFFGVRIVELERQIELERPFMGRFGDIASIEARGRAIRVTLKSGTAFDLDRFSADDLADGLRVWDSSRGVMDFDEWRIRLVEFLPTARVGAAPERLHGTVRTRQGAFTGFVQWDRRESVGTDRLNGRTAGGEFDIRFDTIRSIARNSDNSSMVTLRDGREIVLSGAREVGEGNRGIYVDDPRYGRVLISWEAFESVDFSPGGNGPAFGDFPPGRPLTGSVTTRAGLRLAGRLVYDLDESETTETLDAPSDGVNYNILFGLIASILPAVGEEGGLGRSTVILHSGEELELESAGDLDEGIAGMLIFAGGGGRPEYVPWADVASVDFDRPPAMYPPLGGQ